MKKGQRDRGTKAQSQQPFDMVLRLRPDLAVYSVPLCLCPSVPSKCGKAPFNSPPFTLTFAARENRRKYGTEVCAENCRKTKPDSQAGE
jgi:hypothetical protein